MPSDRDRPAGLARGDLADGRPRGSTSPFVRTATPITRQISGDRAGGRARGEVRILGVEVEGDDEAASALADAAESAFESATIEAVEATDTVTDRLERPPAVDVVCVHDPADDAGVELLETIRSVAPYLPVLLFASDVAIERERAAFEAGATDVVRIGHDAAGRGVLRERLWRAVRGARTRGCRALEEIVDEEVELLEAVGDSTRRLLAASSVEAAADVLVAEAVSTLDLADAAVYLFDGGERAFRRIATASSEGEQAGPPPAERRSIAWEAYVDGSTEAVDRVVAASIGNRGVLLAVPGDADAPDPGAVAVLDLLAVNASAAFDRIERDADRRALEEELNRRTERLTGLRRLADDLHDVARAVTNAGSRTTLEERVCRDLTRDDRFAFAWIGEFDRERRRVAVRTRAGRDRGYLDAVDLTLEGDDGEPAVEAVRERAPAVVDHVSAGMRGTPWRAEAAERGFGSAMSVPLCSNGRLHGVLAVYASDASAFDDLTRRTLEAIGDLVAFGIGALAREHALLTDAVVELEVDLVGGEDVFGRVARETGATVEFDGAVPRDDALLVFLTATDAPGETVHAALRRNPTVEDVATIEECDGTRFEATVHGDWLLSRLGEGGVTLRSLTARERGTRLVVELPRETDVRGFLESIEPGYDSVDLRARRSRARQGRSRSGFLADLEEELTDRQLEVLRTAYRSGYFEWPRRSTGEEVAALLGITQPTLNRHLRTGERKLLTLLFTDADG